MNLTFFISQGLCLKSFQDIHGMEALDILMKNYDSDKNKVIKAKRIDASQLKTMIKAIENESKKGK